MGEAYNWVVSICLKVVQRERGGPFFYRFQRSLLHPLKHQDGSLWRWREGLEVDRVQRRLSQDALPLLLWVILIPLGQTWCCQKVCWGYQGSKREHSLECPKQVEPNQVERSLHISHQDLPLHEHWWPVNQEAIQICAKILRLGTQKVNQLTNQMLALFQGMTKTNGYFFCFHTWKKIRKKLHIFCFCSFFGKVSFVCSRSHYIFALWRSTVTLFQTIFIWDVGDSSLWLSFETFNDCCYQNSVVVTIVASIVATIVATTVAIIESKCNRSQSRYRTRKGQISVFCWIISGFYPSNQMLWCY